MASERPSPGRGIRWDARRSGWRVTVEIGTGTRTYRLTDHARFPVDAPVPQMRAWQDAARVALRARLADDQAQVSAEPAPGETPTLHQAGTTYLADVTAMPSYASRRADLRAWSTSLGDVPVDAITRAQLRGAWNTWRKTGVADNTLNHRRTALLECLRAGGHSAQVRLVRKALKRRRPADEAPREIPFPIIAAILDAMPDSATRDFVRVCAATGLPPQTVRRLLQRPTDVDLARATMCLPARAKGQAVAGTWVPLTPAGVMAFGALLARVARQGFVPAFRRSGLYTSWQRAVTRVQAARQARGDAPLPPMRPYDLRHSFVGLVLDATGGDLQATKEWVQHAELATTLRYAHARVSRSLAAAAVAVAAVQGGLDRGLDRVSSPGTIGRDVSHSTTSGIGATRGRKHVESEENQEETS